MIKEIKIKWLEALRSNKYTKGTGALRYVSDKYCCLGVLCAISPNIKWEIYGSAIGTSFYEASYNNPNEKSGAFLPPSLRDELGIEFSQETCLTNLNDTSDTWDKIIEYIDKEM
jgi:hypothetical protein